MSAYEQITVQMRDRATTITLNRPDRLNAWTGRMADELRNVVGRAGADPGCRCKKGVQSFVERRPPAFQDLQGSAD